VDHSETCRQLNKCYCKSTVFCSPSTPSSIVISQFSEMSLKLRQRESSSWILLIIVILLVKKSSNLWEEQLWKADYCSTFPVKSNISLQADCFVHPADQCTVQTLSCYFEGKMAYLSTEQKQTIKSLYKFARKTIHLETNLEFLTKCIETNFIPKSFRLKNSLPGNIQANQVRIDNICKEAIIEEKHKHIDNLI
jgi:hypothetical protein